jgi:RNA polymerase sigma factor (sigma-70 family)
MQRLHLRTLEPGHRRHVADAVVRDTLAADFDAIRRSLLRRCRGDAQAAAEILAAFCLRALMRAPEVREPVAVRGWLAAILRSAYADHWRARQVERRRHRVEHHEALQARYAEALPDPDARRHAEPCDCLHGLLARLRPDQRELLRAIDLEAGDRAAHARRLGMTRNALDVRLHRARAALKAALLAHCDACSQDGAFDPWACTAPLARGA